MSRSLIDLPLLHPKVLSRYGAKLCNILDKNGRFAWIVGLPLSGRSTVFRQIIYNSRLYSEDQYLLDTFSKWIWVIVDLPAEEDLNTYWTQSTYNDCSTSTLDEKLSEGKKIAFVVNSLDSVDTLGRKVLWNRIWGYYLKFPGLVSIVVGQGVEEADDAKRLLREFYPYFNENKVWFKLYERTDINHYLKIKLEVFGLDISHIDSFLLWEKTGGYLPLMERLVREPLLFKLSDAELIRDEVINYSLEILWNSLSDVTQNWLLSKSRGKKEHNVPMYLSQTGLITEGARFFCRSFALWVERLSRSQKVILSEKGGEIWAGTENLSNILAPQEYLVLEGLWRKKGILLSRDDVAHLLWGLKYEDKYSDWAIDQVISKIRHKIGDLGDDRLIVTRKGKGFTLLDTR